MGNTAGFVFPELLMPSVCLATGAAVEMCSSVLRPCSVQSNVYQMKLGLSTHILQSCRRETSRS
jgi:hypothetical protein